MRIVFILLFIVFTIANSYSQTKYTTKSGKAIKYYESAATFFNYYKTEEAKNEVLKAIEADPNFIEAYMLLGDIYSDMKNYKLSAEAYKKAIAIDPDFFPNNFYNLGKAELFIGEYKDAQLHFEQFLTFKKIGDIPKKIAERGIETCKFAIEAIANPVPFKPVNLDTAINTVDDEYLPTLTADEQTLILTRRKPKAGMPLNSNQLEEDFYYSVKKEGKWTTAFNIGYPINTPANEGAQCISADGRYLFFTACEREDGIGSCDLYMSQKKGSKWTIPINMGINVNSNKWESQPSISPDGQTLYFVSTRSGGKGRMDIWKTTLGNDGNWTTPINLGDTINTSDDEMSPFIHPDNHSLYFSSKGHIGMGGFDIFYSRMNEAGKWDKPQNIGYPINTLADENSLIVSSSGETAYFASDKLEGKGKVDIYSFELYKEARPLRVSYIKGKVSNSKNYLPIDAKFELIDLENAQIVMQSISDPTNGEFLVCLPTDKNYALNVAKDGYLFYSENFSLKEETGITQPFLMNIKLQPIEVGEAVVLRNIFFETASFALKEESKAELNKLILFLTQNPTVKIEIGGHTDNVGEKQYNLNLSQSRAQSVYTYLIENSIDKNRLSYKGFGDSKPIVPNDSDVNRALNRRTEFTIIEASIKRN